MTSKLDTAGLVDRLRQSKANGDPDKYLALVTVSEAHQIADLIEALTPAAAPDMEPVAWRHHGPHGGWITTEERKDWSEEPLYSAAQLSAIQERAERAERERDEAIGARNENAKLRGQRDAAMAKLKAAEARFVELEQALHQIQNEADTLIAAHDPGADVSAMSGHEAQRRIHAFVREATPAIEAIATVARTALAHKGEGRG